MYLHFFITSFLFLIGCIGVFFTRKNLILSIMALELMLLAININFMLNSIYIDSIIGQISTFFILVVGASESAIGLSLIIIYYKNYKYYF
jgi:NADH-quinone oxidoreductase subunit K